MNKCPIELWAVVVRYACTDGGYTGCALSLVSTRMRDVTRSFRYQSIALTSIEGTTAFAAILDSSCPHPNIKHLFISISDFDWWGSRQLGPNDRNTFKAGVNRVLLAAAPTLCTLFLHDSSFIGSMIGGISFPTLTSLSLPELRPALGSAACTHLPSLRRLHVSSCIETRKLLRIFATYAPTSLTHLRITGLCQDPVIVPSLRVLLNISIPLAGAHCATTTHVEGCIAHKLAEVFHRLQHIYIQPRGISQISQWTSVTSQTEMESGLQSIATACAVRMTRKMHLLPETQWYTREEARSHWLNIVEGGEGPWSENAISRTVDESDESDEARRKEASLRALGDRM